MGQAASAQTRRRGILALLTALACLAGCTTAELNNSPSGTAAPSRPSALPAGTVTPQAGAATPSRERPGAVSWPADGTSAADISGIGVVAGPGATRPVPIASVAKLMTAYVILLDHPLSEAEQGPDITVEPSEAAAYSSQAREGDSLVAVAAGEVISERQALEALLLPSADNMAWILARWDAGSQAVLVPHGGSVMGHFVHHVGKRSQNTPPRRATSCPAAAAASAAASRDTYAFVRGNVRSEV
jgi:serine-type D-Ala-D-Ala carboxypeptidase (penicillin-binding protein 5/6)